MPWLFQSRTWRYGIRTSVGLGSYHDVDVSSCRRPWPGRIAFPTRYAYWHE